jgi:threonine dehydrogenase-like Zn-dependent dehydrogenase
MRGTVLYAPRDVRVEDRPDPKIEKPTDAVIRLAATCICGSDLWRYRGIEDVDGPAPIGHEYAGIVEQVGSDVRTIKPGQFVVGSFFASDNTCEICRAGYQTSCIHREPAAPTGAQAQYARIALADGTLVAAPGCPPTTWSRACLQPPTYSAPAGSAPPPPRLAWARPSPPSATAPSAFSACSPPGNSAPTGSSR